MSQKPSQQIRIEPAIVRNIASVEASYRSVLGEIESRWTRQGRVFSLTVRIPSGVHATVILPREYSRDVQINSREPAFAPGVSEVQASQNGFRCIVSGGEYRFVSRPAD
jgi:hypothetical protein